MMWNVNGVGGRGRELRALIQKDMPEVVVLLEVKALTMSGLHEAWPGAKADYNPSRRKSVEAAPRTARRY